MRTALRIIIVLTLASIAALLIDGGQHVAEASPDIPIVDRSGAPPNFWLCAVGVDAAHEGSAGMRNDARSVYERLAGVGAEFGYNAALRARLLVNQDGVAAAAGPNAADDPTEANLAGCIAMFAGAGAGDVVVFYVSSHGFRNENLDAAGDEIGPEPPTLQPGNLFFPPLFPTEEGLVLGKPGGGADFPPGLSDSNFADLWLPPNPGLAPGVSVVAIFDHCFAGGHADGGGTDLENAIGNFRALLMASEAQYVCYEQGGPPPQPDPYEVARFAPWALDGAGGDFTNYLLKGLELVSRPGCAGDFTTRADAVGTATGVAAVVAGNLKRNHNYGQPPGNDDCITTARELFNYASQRTANFVGDDDKDEVADEPGDIRENADAPGKVAGVPGDLLFSEDPPEFVLGAPPVNNDADADANGVPIVDEDGVGTRTAPRCFFRLNQSQQQEKVCLDDCPPAVYLDICRQYPQLLDIEPASVSVGGTTELRVGEAEGAASGGGGGRSSAPYAAVAGGLAAALAVLAAAGWYARRVRRRA